MSNELAPNKGSLGHWFQDKWETEGTAYYNASGTQGYSFPGFNFRDTNAVQFDTFTLDTYNESSSLQQVYFDDVVISTTRIETTLRLTGTSHIDLSIDDNTRKGVKDRLRILFSLPCNLLNRQLQNYQT